MSKGFHFAFPSFDVLPRPRLAQGVRQSINDTFRQAHAPGHLAGIALDPQGIGRVAQEEGRFYYLGRRAVPEPKQVPLPPGTARCWPRCAGRL